MPTETSPGLFPSAKLSTEGFFMAPRGGMVNITYVDLGGQLDQSSICLAKASEPTYSFSAASTIRLSRPHLFQNTGEVLVRDDQEGRVFVSETNSVKTPIEQPEAFIKRQNTLNAALQLSSFKLKLHSEHTKTNSDSTTSAISFGDDWLIYCTSICPTDEKESAWRETFPSSYTSISNIFRPSQFAQGLGLGICEHIGAQGKPAPMKGTFYGFRTFESSRRCQLIVHGPVLYVDDPYRFVSDAEPGWENVSAMIFVKSRKYAAQKEYRFAALSIPSTVGDVFDLPISGILRDCLSPLPVSDPEIAVPVTVSSHENDPPEMSTSPPIRKYTHRRRVTRTSGSSSKAGQDGPEQRNSKEEIVEDIVTSSDELPDSLASREEKRPDIIIFHQIDGSFRFIHDTFREIETETWRIETRPITGEDASTIAEHIQPLGLVLPPSALYESPTEYPMHPELILELCLSPSVPKPPLPSEAMSECLRSEVDHVLACARSLSSAVSLVPEQDQERAASSAWYAYRFVLDLIPLFGPIVKALCVIREAIVVVELQQAPFTGAAAFFTFSGSGIYTLTIRNSTTEILRFSGSQERAFPLFPSSYADVLHENGWHKKIRP